MPGILGRFRDLRKVDRGLDAEVRHALIGALYASTGSLVVGALVGAGVAAIVARYAADPWITLCAALIGLVAASRVASAIAYHRLLEAHNDQAASRWERIYELGAWSYSALLGILGLLTLLRCHNPALHLVTAATAIGYAGGICGRNAGRPAIAIAQLCLAALPVAIGLLIWRDPLYQALGVATLGYILAMTEIVLQLYDVVRRAIVTTNEKRKAAEVLQAALTQAQAANRAKTSFLTTMSHEIRTPLNGVLGMAQTLAAEPLSPAQRDRVDIIRQSGETLLAILNDVLDLAKVEAGKLELEEAAFEIGPVVTQAHAAFGGLARNKGIDYVLSIEPGAEGVYFADSTRFSQIANNLISNAVKFTETGSVKVSLRRRGGVLQFAVTDTGIGISKENLDRIFEKFLQADASTTRRFGGTGLGLALSRELAGLMGGDIAVTSVQGKGSEFVVSLPMRRLSGPARVEASAVPQVAAQAWQQVQSPAQAEAASCPDSADGGRVRILCAEDNEVNQLVLKTLLGQIEVDFEIVGDGAQAVAAWEQAHFDVILMDVQMPVMDGPAATAAIRAAELDAGRNRTPIIALTANVMSHQTAAYIAGGMDEVVAKPIDFKTLLTAIQRQLDGPAADDVGDSAAA